ncbi:phosphotransferase-like protein [Virgibacillus salarius]|uniref:phosphotransferase-like protein n=1 Tax=Virgibacillus salarius TaxID=447199 RepID=UPI003CD0D24E
MVTLNGAPRSGKTSIAQAMQRKSPELWINIGMDTYINMTPEKNSSWNWFASRW